jgi:signal transduction histidine kinase
MLKRWKIRTKLGVFVGVPFLAMLVLGVLGWNTFQNARLEGPRDRQRQAAHDTVADALPPPMYIVESYLTLNLIAQAGDTPERVQLIERLAALEADFHERVEFWRTNQPFPELRETIIGPIKTTGDAFFNRANSDFLLAVQRNDSGATNALLTGELRDLYNDQRAAVDVLIEQSKRQVTVTDTSVSSYVRSRALVLSASFAAILLVTILLAAVIARSIIRSVYRLRKAAVEDLPAAIAQLRSMDIEPGTKQTIALVDLGTQDELADAATAFNAVLQTAVDLAAEQAQLRHHTSEVFVNLGRRNQNLVSRQLKFIDALEAKEADPELLASLFRLDHLATRMRRNAESLLVLAGVQAPRRRSEPVAINDVLRAAAAEVEDYKRVAIREVHRSRIVGDVMAQVTHLMAEIIENAVRFSPPDTMVEVVSRVIDGQIVIEVSDQGTGISPAELQRVNKRLAESHRIEDVPTAHLGLFVVGRLAATLDIRVQLETHSGEGLIATVTIPAALVAGADQGNSAVDDLVPVRVPSRRTARHEFIPEGFPTERPAVVPPVALSQPLPPQAPLVSPPPTAPSPTASSAIGSMPWGAPPAPVQLAAVAPPSVPRPVEVVASTGFERRVRPSSGKPAPIAMPIVAEDRSADAARNRMAGFASGRRRGLETTPDHVADTAADTAADTTAESQGTS